MLHGRVVGAAVLVLVVAAACGEVERPGSAPATSSTSTSTSGTAPPETAAPPESAVPAETAAPPTAPPGTVPDPSPDAEWRTQLAQLRIAEPSPRGGYDRSLFDHWIDADKNRCNTRCEVLLREFRQDLPEAPNGGWFSVYDGVVTAESSDLDVDHTVALSEAWVSGADQWDQARRREFANDLEPGALRAVTASVNRSKGDRDPAEWQPPRRESWCEYAADWVRTKHRWQLSADPEEFTALVTMLEGCP